MSIDIRSVHIFSSFEDDQLSQILETSRTLSLQDGQILFGCGEEAARFYLVIEGQIKLYCLSASGDEKIVDIVQRGNTFAEALMFMERPVHLVSAAALGPARVISFDCRRFKKTLSKSIDSCFMMMNTMSRQLCSLIKDVEELTLQTASARVCHMLLRQMQKTHSLRFRLHAAKGALASRLSIKPETFSRILHDLSAKGVIQVERFHIKVRNPQALLKAAQLNYLTELKEEALTWNPVSSPSPIFFTPKATLSPHLSDRERDMVI
jgi:CRP-like cAMP-binding protein